VVAGAVRLASQCFVPLPSLLQGHGVYNAACHLAYRWFQLDGYTLQYFDGKVAPVGGKDKDKDKDKDKASKGIVDLSRVGSGFVLNTVEAGAGRKAPPTPHCLSLITVRACTYDAVHGLSMIDWSTCHPVRVPGILSCGVGSWWW
jgi:hypothetical protein